MVVENSPDVLSRLMADGEHALADLFMTQRPRLRMMVHRRLDPRLAKRVDASDILQEGYVDAARRLNEYLSDPHMPFFLWLRFLVKQRLCAVHRKHLSAGKRDVRREDGWPAPCRQSAESDSLAMEFSARISSPSQQVARAELQRRLRQLIDSLDPLDREIIALRHFEELSNNEAAAELGISKFAASKRYLRAIERMRAATESFLQSNY